MDHYGDRIYVNAKIYSFHSAILGRKDYIDIISTKSLATLIPDAPSSISKNNYKEIKELIFRSQVQGILALNSINDFYENYFQAFLRYFEILNLKQLLSKLNRGKLEVCFWYDIGPWDILTGDMPDRVLSIDDIIELTSGSYLAPVVSEVINLPYEIAEIAIDISIIKHLIRLSRKLWLADADLFFDIICRKIVLLKEDWSYRLKEYYGWGNERIEERFGYLTGNILEAGYLLKKIAVIGNLSEMDFWVYINKKFYSNFHSIAPVLSYLWLVYFQIRNLFRIVEGIRYGVKPEVILKQIVCGD